MKLSDCFAELFSAVVDFRKTAEEKQPAYEPVRNEILRLLRLSEDLALRSSGHREDYDLARYGVCAWIDEIMLAASWNQNSRWRPELLQRLFYNSAEAGRNFFDKLNGLGSYQKEVREVYYLCLALGFKGRYCDPSDAPTLEQLKEHQLKVLFENVMESPSLLSFEQSKLFPDAYQKQVPVPSAANRSSQRRLFWMMTLGGPAAFCLLLFMIYRFILYSLGENILRAVHLS